MTNASSIMNFAKHPLFLRIAFGGFAWAALSGCSRQSTSTPSTPKWQAPQYANVEFYILKSNRRCLTGSRSSYNTALLTADSNFVLTFGAADTLDKVYTASAQYLGRGPKGDRYSYKYTIPNGPTGTKEIEYVGTDIEVAGDATYSFGVRPKTFVSPK